MNLRSQRLIVQFWKISLGLIFLLASDLTFAQVTITEVTTPSLGSLLAGASGRDFVLNTDDTVSGADAADYLFGAQSGQVDISKSGGGQDATIVANNFSTTGGVTINGVPCKWRNEAPTTCHGSGITKQIRSQARALKLGVDIDTSQVHSGGDSATATYDIDVTLI
jgi:hypothetical protein